MVFEIEIISDDRSSKPSWYLPPGHIRFSDLARHSDAVLSATEALAISPDNTRLAVVFTTQIMIFNCLRQVVELSVPVAQLIESCGFDDCHLLAIDMWSLESHQDLLIRFGGNALDGGGKRIGFAWLHISMSVANHINVICDLPWMDAHLCCPAGESVALLNITPSLADLYLVNIVSGDWISTRYNVFLSQSHSIVWRGHGEFFVIREDFNTQPSFATLLDIGKCSVGNDIDLYPDKEHGFPFKICFYCHSDDKLFVVTLSMSSSCDELWILYFSNFYWRKLCLQNLDGYHVQSLFYPAISVNEDCIYFYLICSNTNSLLSIRRSLAKVTVNVPSLKQLVWNKIVDKFSMLPWLNRSDLKNIGLSHLDCLHLDYPVDYFKV